VGNVEYEDPHPDQLELFIFRNCGVGQPGYASCPPNAGAIVATGNHFGLPTVAVNPCTHHAVVAYRTDYDGPSPRVRLQFYDPLGNVTGSFSPNANYPPSTADGCYDHGGCPGDDGNVPRCGAHCGTDCGGSGCLRLANRPTVVTKYDSGSAQCYAYLAFDFRCGSTGPDGDHHVKSRLLVVNITDESAPYQANMWQSSSCANSNNNEFMAVPAVNDYTSNVGYFFYRQNGGNPCTTLYTGRVSSNLGLDSGTQLSALSGTFPSIRAVASGMGDYTGALNRGLGGGYLFPVWAQPVAITAPGVTCTSCQTTEYSLAIMGARVRP
jgi:hypothetical protein